MATGMRKQTANDTVYCGPFGFDVLCDAFQSSVAVIGQDKAGKAGRKRCEGYPKMHNCQDQIAIRDGMQLLSRA